MYLDLYVVAGEYLFRGLYPELSDKAIGGILLVISLAILCICLVLMVKILHSLLQVCDFDCIACLSSCLLACMPVHLPACLLAWMYTYLPPSILLYVCIDACLSVRLQQPN